MSDLKVKFLEPDEVRDFIEEHIRRYADVYAPPGTTNDQDPIEEDEGAASTHNFSAEGDSEDEVSETDLSDASERRVSTIKKRGRKSPKHCNWQLPQQRNFSASCSTWNMTRRKKSPPEVVERF